ncbi:MAG: Gfo/Idh/MocA family oxidoreductase [Acidimicrobiia bacterium]|nr:Gfo/Idh/MocA family oxidoreductase [Acidimicrobiia bacterium]
MSDLVRVGFVGCGLIARSHARGLQACGEATIVAVHDTDPERAHSFALDVVGTASVVVADAETVIETSEAVYVCTWTAAHADLVAAVAAAGKPVFCEKPLAIDLATAEAMTRAVESAGVVNQVGLVLRNSPSFRWLRHQVRSPELGPLMNIVFRDDQYLPTQGMYGSTWRGDVAKAGAGTLLEHSIHDLDLLGWMMGPIRSVSGRIGMVHGLDGIDDQASVLLVSESGAQATLTSVWHEVLSRPSQRRVEAFCRDAVLTLDGDWAGPVSIESSMGTDELEGSVLARAMATLDGLGVNPDAAFITAVRSSIPAYPDFRVAIEAHRLADAAYRSAATGGQPVDL